MIASRRWFSCGSGFTTVITLVVAFGNGSAFAQQPVHPLNPPALPANSPSSRPVTPEAIPFLVPQTTPASLTSSGWTAIGPASLNSGGGQVSGRITGIAVDPTSTNIIYVAAAGGGVWKTTDGGTTWTALTDTQTTLAMGAIAIAPTDHLRIYAGTGEANNAGDSNHGIGILVSSDAGSTWTLETAGGAFAGVSIGQIAVDPTNENIAYAAVGGYSENGNTFSNTGIWKTTDGGTTWANTTTAISSYGSEMSWSSVVVDPNTPSIVYAAIGDIFYGGYGPNGVYRSTNGGSTWALLTGAPSGAATGRIALAVSPAAKTAGQHVLYVAMSTSLNPGSGGLYYFGRSDNADATTPTFTNLTSTTPDFLGGENGSGQGWYDMAVNVDSAGTVYCAGVENYSGGGTQNIIRSANLGVNWSDISIVGGVEPHTDSHAIALDFTNRMLIGNDGGIWRYDATVPSWTNLNGNLNTIQFQGISLHPTSAGTVLGGSQDNGTELYTGSLVWAETDGGDGGFAQISQTTSTRCYAVHPVGSFGPTAFFRRSDSSCAAGTWIAETTGFLNANSDFYPPFVVDPTNGDHLVIGLDRVYESTSAANPWTAISTPGTNGFNNVISGTTNNVDTVALAPANGVNPEVIYAATGNGSGGSLIFVTTNDGGAWTERDLPACTATGHYSAGCRVNQIVTDPSDPTGNTAVAVTNNFTGGGMHVYRTTNAGATWTDISSLLPDLPTWSAQIDTDPSHTIYVSTDSGIYSSVNPYSAWTRFGSGLPNAQGIDLELNRTLHVLAVGTHGRGAWEIDTPAHVTNVTTTTANGTYGSGASIPIVVTFSTPVTVTGTPQLTLDTIPNATATYSSGSGSNALTFAYTVANGQTTNGNGTGGLLDYTSSGALTLNGGMIADGSGVPAVLMLYAPASTGSLSANSSIVISTGMLIKPTVTVTPSSSKITRAEALQVIVSVIGGSGNPTPTGSVTLSGGGYTSSAATLNSGSATINIAAGNLSVGNDTLSAAYTPDSSSSAIYSSANGSASVTVINSTLPCASPNPNPNPNPVSFAVAGDFNADCKSDILWRNSTTGEVYSWFMNGTSTASQGSLGVVSSNWVIQGVGDFDGDGKADILWRNSATGEVYIWLLNGTTVTSQGSLGVVSSNWTIQNVGDFNGDGRADILWRNSTTGEVYIWLMNGTTIASGGTLGVVSSNWVIQGIGDFDGDGKADILWRNSSTGEVYIWLMNGTSIVSQGSLGVVSSNWVIQGVGDFNGDGNADILWQNSTTGEVYIWLMNGTTITSGGSLGVVSSNWVIQVIGDYNGDAKADMLWRNSTTGEAQMWLLNGTSIASQGSLGIVSSDWQIFPILYP